MIGVILAGCVASLAMGLLAEPIKDLPAEVVFESHADLPWYGLWKARYDRDAVVSWKSRWWFSGWKSAPYRALHWAGLWSVEDGAFYWEGRFAIVLPSLASSPWEES